MVEARLLDSVVVCWAVDWAWSADGKVSREASATYQIL